MSSDESSFDRRRAAEERWRRFVGEVREGRHADFDAHWRLFQSLDQSLAGDFPPLAAWWPDPPVAQQSNLTALMAELGIDRYVDLHRWSVQHREELWRRVVARLGIRFRTAPDRILDLPAGIEQPRWLPNAAFNIVDSCFEAPPDTPAIVWGSDRDDLVRSVTYAELQQLVDRIANGLGDHGFRQDQAIALYMPMTVDCVALYLGIIRAGGRVVSVADSFSATELQRRMEIAGASWVVCLSAYGRAGRRIDLYDKVRRALDGLAGDTRCILIPAVGEPLPKLGPRDLAWSDLLGATAAFDSAIGPPDRVTNVLLSSGTTGEPKAIAWNQLTPLKCAMDGHFHHDIHPGDVVAWPTNIGWMMGPWLIYASLLNRATMALYEGAPHSAGFTRFVGAARVTMLGLVPALVRAWRAADLIGLDGWPRVRVFSSTGEVSNAEDYLWLMSRAGYRAPVIEYLGGTEIGGGHITGTVLQPASPATFTTPALGLDFVILDEAGRPVGDGEMGELFLVPPSIGLSQELLNKDHHEIYFEGCPKGPSGELLRRHGDQFTQLGGGYFKAQGRADDTMNLGGIKVSCIELEEVLNQHPAVFESAAVAVQPSGEGADRLVVYVVLRTECEPARLHQELRERLAEELNPLFKIYQVVPIEALPRTASNKVMRRQLRSRYLATAHP